MSHGGREAVRAPGARGRVLVLFLDGTALGEGPVWDDVPGHGADGHVWGRGATVDELFRSWSTAISRLVDPSRGTEATATKVSETAAKSSTARSIPREQSNK